MHGEDLGNIVIGELDQHADASVWHLARRDETSEHPL